MTKKSYRIGVLVNTSRTEKLAKTVELLLSRIEDMGHKPILIWPPEIDILAKGNGSEILNLADRPDVVINRHDIAQLTDHEIQAIKVLEGAQIPFVNSMEKSLIVHKKFLVNKVLMSAGVPFPPMAKIGTIADLSRVVKFLGGFPLVLKASQSNQGKGVVLISNMKTFRSMYDFIQNSKIPEDYLLQAYVPEAAALCIRAVIVDNKIVAVFGRKPARGDFRSNLRKGTLTSQPKLGKKEESILLSIPKILGLEIVGIDFARTAKGIKIIEVNSYPGFGEFFKASGLDLSSSFVKAAVRKIEGGRLPRKPRRRI